MSPLVQRVVAALGANAFGQVVVIIIQLFSLPIFLYKWDAATYGIWLMLSALPAYLSMADIGMVSTAGNRMTMEVSRGNYEQANVVLHSAFVFMLAMCASVLAVCIPLILLAPIPLFSEFDRRLALAALVTGVLCAQFNGLCEAIFRATLRHSQGIMLGNLIRLAEWGGAVGGLFLFNSFPGVALGSLSLRLAGIAAAIVWVRSSGGGLTLGVKLASKHEVMTMLRPALSFMAFPLSNALSIQGITLIVGHLFGPIAVTVFNTYRTISRIAVQITSIFSNALWAEFSQLFGKNKITELSHLFKRSQLIGITAATLLSVATFFLGPYILEFWTHGRIGFEASHFGILLAYAAAAGVWHLPRVLLMATNQHIDLSKWNIASSLLAFGMAYLFGRLFGIDGVAMAMLVSEAAIAFICIKLANDVLTQTTSRAQP